MRRFVDKFHYYSFLCLSIHAETTKLATCQKKKKSQVNHHTELNVCKLINWSVNHSSIKIVN